MISNEKITRIKALCFVVMLLMSTSMFAQTNLYQCDFEDESERLMWSDNVGSHGKKCPNRWYFGAAGANGGDFGFFVSNDGKTNNYTASEMTVVSYRSLNLKADSYELSFDWKAGGRTDSISDIDGLYVCWVPDNEDDSTLIVSYNGPGLDKLVEKYALDFGRGSKRLSKSSWNTIVDTVVSDGTPHKLMFVWRNGNSGASAPAVCVDNILVMPKGYCDKPYDLKLDVSDFNATFSWSGSSEAYDVRCYNERTKKWKEYQNIRDHSVVIEGVDEGMCTYYVRSRCEGISGTWVSISQFVYYAGNRCIDYLALSSENCFTSYNPIFRPGSSWTGGMVDKGYLSEMSRHTIHYDLEERDPRTKNGLRTVPEGEIASVRLGNWLTGGEAERVEYKYRVDTTSSAVLILKYAVVLQDPKHGKADQPKFELEILKNGERIDKNGCGEAKFTAGENMLPSEGWHEFSGDGNGVGWWKDWTTVSINLREHHNEEVLVRLTTYDCAEEGHFAYAYFTLNCSDGRIQSSACGDVEYDTLTGPEGFNYRWYKRSDPNNTLSEAREWRISTTDTAVYCLDVIQPTKTECYYTLQTSGLQRYPKADYKYEALVEKCENKVKFTDQRYIATKNAKGEMVNSGESCDVVWDFGDGSTSSNANPAHFYPSVGGKYTVRLTASMNGKCEDIKEFEIELPNVTDMRDTVDAVICNGGSYEFAGQTLYESGYYSDTLTTEYGCDNITVLNLRIIQDTIIYDTICSNEEYYFNNERITETGRYSIKSVLGCDSIVLDLLVNESLVLDIDSVISVCATDPNIIIPYIETSGSLLEFGIQFDDPKMSAVSAKGLRPNNSVMEIPMMSGVEPNRYKAILSFGDFGCGGDDISLFIDVYYPDSVIAQRWNDVLAVRNIDYNGGYEFVEYQWYQDGTPIVGATSSILYVEGGLDVTSNYSVLLTRADGVKEMVCDVQPKQYAETEAAVVVFSMGEGSRLGVRTTDSSNVKVWSSTGLLVGEYSLVQGENYLDMNLQSGLYILEFLLEDGSHEIERIVVR